MLHLTSFTYNFGRLILHFTANSLVGGNSHIQNDQTKIMSGKKNMFQ